MTNTWWKKRTKFIFENRFACKLCCVQCLKGLGQEGLTVAVNGLAEGPWAAERQCRFTLNKEHRKLLIFRVPQNDVSFGKKFYLLAITN